MKKELWPDQFVNRKVQEHEEIIIELKAQLEEIKKNLPKKRGPKPKE
jgi:hypothetical protein